MPYPNSNAGWVAYYARRWERAGRDSLLQLALFYEFMRLMEIDP
jgi:hypothetical protein